MKKYLILLMLFFIPILTWSQDLRTAGKKIIDKNGNEVILRGMGLGGWMLQEGYMMQSSDVADTQHEFRNRLVELMGNEKTDDFYNAWLENHVTKKDIDSLAKWGFNSVRLPMHYNLFTLPIEDEPVQGENTWLTKGFSMVDNLLDWCESNNMYLILDLHAAPGGQGANAAISDYDPSKPSLWESQDNRNKTIALWKKLAERYKDEPWIGGYDLLNEVNWTLPNNTQLRSLYIQITNAIREVDTNHIIFIEGNSFANDFTGLTPAWDANMVYSFHKYWTFNTKESIQWVLNLRDNQNVPLWMGEAGENSNVWFTEAIQLFEDNNIGWSWWPMKRIETIVGPYSIEFSEGYKKILSYWRNQAAKPSVDEAYAAMIELANNTNSSNCSYQKDVPDAMIRQVATDAIIPYSDHKIPGVIYMSDFDLGKLNIAYYDADYANYSGGSGEFQAWNSGWIYRNDGVDIQTNKDAVNSNGYHIGFVKKGEWMHYTVNVNESGTYKAAVRLASQYSGGKFHLEIDGQEVTTTQTVNSTGGWEVFQNFDVNNIALDKGKHVLKFQFDAETEFNLSSIKFSKTGAINESNFSVLNGHAISNNKVGVVVNQSILPESINGSKADFSMLINGIEVPITNVTFNSDKNRTLVLTTDKTIIYTDIIKVSYTGTQIKSEFNTVLNTFSELEIRNTLETLFVIPGKIEAENFVEMEGLSIESSTDVGGGSNIGYTDANDYADYIIYAEAASNYKVNFRIAAAFNKGEIGMYLVDENNTETELLKVATIVTGGWQTWETVAANLKIPKGIQKLRMRIISGGFNLNWMDFELLEDNGDSDGDGVLDEEDDCPNTPEGATVNTNGCEIFTVPANNFTIEAIGESCPDKKNGKFIITAIETHNYKVTINNSIVRNFTKAITLGSLAPGKFEICISVENEDFEQCFSLTINASNIVLGKINITNNKASVEMEKGTAPYKVFINNIELFSTMASKFNVDVSNGDKLDIKSANDCEGVYSKQIELDESVKVYPNPSTSLFTIKIPNQLQNKVLVEVYNYASQLIVSKYCTLQFGKISLDLTNIPTGTYIAKVYLAEPLNVKIVKN